ncbi:hypothetical protein [Streptomyces alanosinicus]|uniref:Lipoprotein n=1 Tax=Streptomyces alanosinicus TaxID=68171 RepID=A0A919D5T0_9ACTN|nr:hypothetical protein [Streptomyces alanosinicus]GHE09340.1 lipoprotein [Streptomyces alanosinicus]
MHRTTTTAALLATVAVSALAGCVTVRHPATPAPSRDTAPALPTAPRPDGTAEPRVVQAPAREALEMTGPSRHPGHPSPSAARHLSPSAPRHPVEAPPLAHRPPAAPPAPPRPREHPRQPHTTAPERPNPVPRAPGVCALGRQYGGWSENSPESRICDQTYGH